MSHEYIDQRADLLSSTVHKTVGSSSLSLQSEIDTEINRAHSLSNFIFTAPPQSSCDRIEPHHSMHAAARSKHR
jgi:hypothetical protein